MKSTIKVSISRSAFHLNNDAYEMLRDYLDRLEKHFKTKEGGKEIVSDIEERLAELFTARISTPEQVITLSLVEEIIGIMGMPDNMEGEDSTEGSAAPASPNRKKRLYRDVDNIMVSGVCSGLAAYCNIDATFVRLCFVFFFIGFSVAGISIGWWTPFVAYLILWIVVPPARTLREKMEMRNDNITIANIQKKVEDEINMLRQKWERKGKTWTPEVEEEILTAGLGTKHSENVLLHLFKVCLRVCMVFIGVICLIIAVCGLIALPIGLFAGIVLSDVVLFDILDFIAIDINLTLFKILLLLVLLLPLLDMVYFGVKIITGFRDRFRIGLIMFLLWLAACIVLLVSASSSVIGFRRWTDVKEEIRLPTQYDTLYVNVPEQYRDFVTDRALLKYEDNGVIFWDSNCCDEPKIYVLPNMDIEHVSDTGAIRVCFIKTASGKNIHSARSHARNIPLNYALQDSLLTIEPFVYSKNRKWAGEVVAVKIYVPSDKKVKMEIPYKNEVKFKHIKIDLDWD